ncbi:MAG: translation initiation factor IF-2 [Gemmataceae bacterium]
MADNKGMRVYQLAKTLEVETKELIDFCRELGFDGIKNQLNQLSAEQCDAVTRRVKEGPKIAPAPAVAPGPLPTSISTKVQSLPSRVKARSTDEAQVPAESESVPSPVIPPVTTPIAAQVPETPAVAPPEPPVAPAPLPTLTPTRLPNLSGGKMPNLAPKSAPPSPPVTPPVVQPAATLPPPPPPVAPPVATPPPPVVAQHPTPTPPPSRPTPPPAPPQRTLNMGGAPMRNLGGPRPSDSGSGPRPGGGSGRTPMIRRQPTQSNITTRSTTPTLRQPGGPTPPPPRPGSTPPAKKEIGGVRKLAPISQELMNKSGPITVKEVMDAHNRAATPPGGAAPVVPSGADEEDEKGRGKSGPGRGPGGVAGRDQRRVQRDARAKERKGTTGVQLQGGQVVVVEDERHRKRGGKVKLRPKKPGTVERKGKVPIKVPITVRSLSEAVGVAAPKVLSKLMELGVPFGSVTINSVIDIEMAELIATDVGVELEIAKQADAEEQLLESLKTPDDAATLVPRAPIVTIMGHVDHGKTSLLDRIREMYGFKSDVVSTEAGGITQVIRAWRVEKDGKPTTFLDTPGHEAFTKMRARGAQVTDIAVIVVAATDGVMPQTEEAISHAKAAGVSLIIAINKVDMPNANLTKTRQQLYSLDVLPDNMGGDVPFVETSAITGQGIDELLEAIAVVAELKELKANPDKPGQGTCLEAHLRGDEGVFATLLVREGTLKKGDIILCGHAYGRVRQMYSDLGRSIVEAGPSVPVRITGLDEVPNADDPFQVVTDVSLAREIAEKRKARNQESLTYLGNSAKKGLGQLGATKISELKVILKADFRGSIEAIRKELEKFVHDEVAVRLLHAGIGAITVSDVQLALTSPTDTIIVGFNCVPDDDALRLAEERGIQIREYDIIYKLTADIKSALEGKLKPREEVIHLGRAIVRQTFKISRVGTIAGCHVTQGAIERSAKVRVIRGGVVIFPPADRVASLESLKHHKDDVREAKQGYDCGIKIAGYDDIKPDDVIEAYRIEQVQRTL